MKRELIERRGGNLLKQINSIDGDDLECDAMRFLSPNRD